MMEIEQGRLCEGVSSVAKDFAPGIRLYMVRLSNIISVMCSGEASIMTRPTSKNRRIFEYCSPCSQGCIATRESFETGGSNSGRTNTAEGRVRQERWRWIDRC